MPETFADVLGHYVQRSHYAAPQVAALSGVSRRTIANWLGGIALKPQQWQAVVKVAAALKLNEAETSHLLMAAGHSPLPELRHTAVSYPRCRSIYVSYGPMLRETDRMPDDNHRLVVRNGLIERT